MSPLKDQVRWLDRGQQASQVTAITPAVVWQALDALPDGIALADDTGEIRLVNGRLEEMFGYRHGQLPGRSLQILVPALCEMLPGASDPGWAQPPAPLPVSGGAWLAGTRKDGTAFPVQISLRPVPSRTGRFTLAVIRDATKTAQREEPAAISDQDPAALPARQQHLEELLNKITSSIFEVGIVLSTAADMPADGLNHRIDEAVRLLDDVVCEIYDAAFRPCG